MSDSNDPIVPIRQLAPVILLGAVHGLVGGAILSGMAGFDFAYFLPAGTIAGAAIGFSLGAILSAASDDSAL
jgi:hypothetical protein